MIVSCSRADPNTNGGKERQKMLSASSSVERNKLCEVGKRTHRLERGRDCKDGGWSEGQGGIQLIRKRRQGKEMWSKEGQGHRRV